MEFLARTIDRISRGVVVLILGLLFAAFLFIFLPQSAQVTAAYSGGLGIPDTLFIYSADRLYDLAQAYGVAGRAAFIRGHLTVDLAFPLTYGLFFATTIAFTYRRAWPERSKPRRLPNVPLWAATADLIENAALVGVMALYPEPSVLLAALAAFATPIKWILVGFALLLVLVGVVAWLFAGLRSGSSS